MRKTRGSKREVFRGLYARIEDLERAHTLSEAAQAETDSEDMPLLLGLSIVHSLSAFTTTSNDRDEIEHALSYYYGRKNQTPRQPEEFMGEYPRRIYKAVPKKFWLNGEGLINGNYIDKRTEVSMTI